MTTIDLDSNSRSLLMEVALKADEVARTLDNLSKKTMQAAQQVARGTAPDHASDITRIADEYAIALTELQQSVKIARLFVKDMVHINTAMLGMEALMG